MEEVPFFEVIKAMPAPALLEPQPLPDTCI
jgi:hypothetical protein